jgi:hypothetical protein
MKPSTKFIVAGFPHRLAAPPDAFNASTLYWRSFSPFWWAVVQSLIGGLDQAYIWENYSDELQDQIMALMLPEEPPCEDCQDPPPPAPEQPPGGGSGGAIAGVGATGLSVEELEGLLMGSIMDVRIFQGKLQVQRFPCCDWVDVGSIAGIAQQSSIVPTTITEAIAAGIANFPSVPSSPPLQTGFDNPTTRACVKATAIKYTFLVFLTDLRDYLDEAVNDLALAIAGIVGGLALAGWGKLVPSNLMGQVLNLFGKDDLLQELNEFLADDEFWNDFVCLTANDLSTANEVTGLDIAAGYERMVAGVLGTSEAVLELLTKLSITEFQGKVSFAMAHVGCECDDYLPVNYTPPPIAGAVFQFDELMHWFKSVAATTPPNALDGGLPFEKNPLDPDSGAVVSSGVYRTTFKAITGGYTYTTLVALFKFNQPTDIQQVKVDVDFVGVLNEASVSYYGFEPAAGWNDFAGGIALASGELVLTGTFAAAEYMAMVVRTFVESTSSTAYAELSNVRVTGEVGGVAFQDIGEGQTLP